MCCYSRVLSWYVGCLYFSPTQLLVFYKHIKHMSVCWGQFFWWEQFFSLLHMANPCLAQMSLMKLLLNPTFLLASWSTLSRLWLWISHTMGTLGTGTFSCVCVPKHLDSACACHHFSCAWYMVNAQWMFTGHTDVDWCASEYGPFFETSRAMVLYAVGGSGNGVRKNVLFSNCFSYFNLFWNLFLSNKTSLHFFWLQKQHIA